MELNKQTHILELWELFVWRKTWYPIINKNKRNTDSPLLSSKEISNTESEDGRLPQWQIKSLGKNDAFNAWVLISTHEIYSPQQQRRKRCLTRHDVFQLVINRSCFTFCIVSQIFYTCFFTHTHTLIRKRAHTYTHT